MASTKNKIKPARIYYQVRFEDNGFDITRIPRQFKGAEPIESIDELFDKKELIKEGLKEKDLKFFYKIDTSYEPKIEKFMSEGIITYKSRAITVCTSSIIRPDDDRYLHKKPIESVD